MRRARLRSLAQPLAVLVVALTAPAMATAQTTLRSEGDYVFQIWTGSSSSGAGRITGACLTTTTPACTGYGAFDSSGSMRLRVDGSTYVNSSNVFTTSMDGHQIDLPPVNMGLLLVSRHVYVPEMVAGDGGTYARFIDVFENRGMTDATVSLEYYINLAGTGAASQSIVTTFSGDGTWDADDRWVTADDADARATDFGTSNRNPVGFVLSGARATVTPTAVTLTSGTDTFNLTYDDVVVPAGQRVAIVQFAIQEVARAATAAEARRLADLPADALEGADEWVPDIVNFAIGGAPIVRFTSPSAIDEGEGVVIDVEVIDREGDTATWSWDLDDDGTFGENPGETSYGIPATMTDGDGEIRVGVEASDGTETRRLYRTVSVANLPPVINSRPPNVDPPTPVGEMFRHEMTAIDPAGDNDPLSFTLVSGPDGMTVTRDGLLRWTPTRTQRGMTFDCEVQVDDSDGGTGSQEFQVRALDNRRPPPPMLLSPIDSERTTEAAPTLLVANSIDPDGDDLTYYFQIDRVSSFESDSLIKSPAVTETGSETGWNVTSRLTDGVWYWQAWTSDGRLESLRRHASCVVGGAGQADAGVGGDGGMRMLPKARDEGCSVTAAGSRGQAASLGGLLLMLGLVGLRRRRR